MTRKWGPDRIIHVDRKGDADRASDGYSRYGSYVGAREDSFQDRFALPKVQPIEGLAFATTAWHIATPPVMSPGLVDWRPDIHSVKVGYSEDGDGLMVTLKVPLQHRELAAKIPYTYQDWAPGSWRDDGYEYLMEPGTRRATPTVVATVEIRHILSGVTLVSPGKPTGRQLVDDALLSVEYTAAAINAELPEIVRAVQGQPLTVRREGL